MNKRPRNVIAKDLRTPKYKMRVVKDKKKHQSKREARGKHDDSLRRSREDGQTGRGHPTRVYKSDGPTRWDPLLRADTARPGTVELRENDEELGS